MTLRKSKSREVDKIEVSANRKPKRRAGRNSRAKKHDD